MLLAQPQQQFVIKCLAQGHIWMLCTNKLAFLVLSWCGLWQGEKLGLQKTYVNFGSLPIDFIYQPWPFASGKYVARNQWHKITWPTDVGSGCNTSTTCNCTEEQQQEYYSGCWNQFSTEKFWRSSNTNWTKDILKHDNITVQLPLLCCEV